MEGINGHGYLYIIYSLYSDLFHFKTLLLRTFRIHKQVVPVWNLVRYLLQLSIALTNSGTLCPSLASLSSASMGT